MPRSSRRLLLASAFALGLCLPVTGLHAQEIRVLTSVPSLGFPFFVHMMKELQAEGAALGVATVESDGQNSTPKQTADVETAIAAA